MEINNIIILKTNQLAHKGMIGFDDENLELFTDLTAKASNTYGYDFYPVHLYELSDDEIKEGDIFIREFDNVITKANINSDHKHYNCKKIIATTDRYLTPITHIGETVDDFYPEEFRNNIKTMSQETIKEFIKHHNKQHYGNIK